MSIITNQFGSINGDMLDTNTLQFASDYFQCFDILLTNGPNTITLHATDPAGNRTNITLNVTLDYSIATNPVVGLAWPQDGMEISGDSFTLRGQVDDTSSSAKASITDEDGNTTTAYGMVERDGTLWVDDLPLADGENDVALTVVNSAGHSSESDFAVVKSDMILTLDSIDGDLWQPWVNVYGSISDTNYTVSVNGVPGVNNGDGTWSASQVPVSTSGVASFDMTASPPMADASSRLLGRVSMANSSSVNLVNANKRQDKPDEVKLESGTWTREYGANLDDGMGGSLEYYIDDWNWSLAAGGMETLVKIPPQIRSTEAPSDSPMAKPMKKGQPVPWRNIRMQIMKNNSTATSNKPTLMPERNGMPKVLSGLPLSAEKAVRELDTVLMRMPNQATP